VFPVGVRHLRAPDYIIYTGSRFYRNPSGHYDIYAGKDGHAIRHGTILLHGGNDMKKLSKFLSMILIAAMIVTGFSGFSGNTKVFAAEEDTPLLIATAAAPEEITVYVSVSLKGDLVVRQQSVTVTDIDADGAFTINDALYCTHEKYYKGGAAEGFAADEGQWGLYITKLWGDTSGNFGFYVNNTMAMGLADPVSDKDYLTAWVYKEYIYNPEDGTTVSDNYTAFNKNVISLKKGEAKKLTLNYYEFDENWALVPKPYKNAVITIGGQPTEINTGKKGKFTLQFNKSGSYFISAVSESDDFVIVPPTMVVFVQPDKGEVIKVKKNKYTVTKLGNAKKDKKGKVTFSLGENNGRKAPKKIEYAGVTYKVTVVD